MTVFRAHADQPITLADRLDQLNDHLHHLGGNLKDAIASAVSAAVGDAVHDAIRSLLCKQGSPNSEQWYS